MKIINVVSLSKTQRLVSEGNGRETSMCINNRIFYIKLWRICPKCYSFGRPLIIHELPGVAWNPTVSTVVEDWSICWISIILSPIDCKFNTTTVYMKAIESWETIINNKTLIRYAARFLEIWYCDVYIASNTYFWDIYSYSDKKRLSCSKT